MFASTDDSLSKTEPKEKPKKKEKKKAPSEEIQVKKSALGPGTEYKEDHK